MYQVSVKIRVRFADVDSLGHVNNAKYFTYMEEARMEYFKRIPELDFVGVSGNSPLSFVIAAASCDFKQPAHLGDELNVGISITSCGNKSFVTEYEITRVGTSNLVAKGKSTSVMFNYQQNCSVEIPKKIREQIDRIEGRSH
jgi:acyl-CoA thioester hydrolase